MKYKTKLKDDKEYILREQLNELDKKGIIDEFIHYRTEKNFWFGIFVFTVYLGILILIGLGAYTINEYQENYSPDYAITALGTKICELSESGPFYNTRIYESFTEIQCENNTIFIKNEKRNTRKA